MTSTDRTPMALMFLCDCMSCGTPMESHHIRDDVWTAFGVGPTYLRVLQEEGLIDEKFQATEKGRAWVEHLLKTPYPVEKWVVEAKK